MVENFCRFMSLPSFHEKRNTVTSFTSFHSIHMQKFAKNLLQLRSNPCKAQMFYASNEKQCMVHREFEGFHNY